ncbi:MAG TPA: hypothetical protein VL128_16800 [Candidatus Eisenbacteria bacterium]|nr:hypothetical protein [Candidatus Eisenbacteria bacterium]
MRRTLVMLAVAGFWFAGCGSEAPKPSPAAEAKPAEPAVPEEMTDAAHALLGSDSQVLIFGDLAKTDQPEFLAANVVPNTPKSKIAGTVVTRAVVAEKRDGKWVELMRADEYLKNPKGFLGLTPLQAVTGWHLQYEQSPVKGLTMYFTPVKEGSNERALPIAVAWNPAAKRYQSLDLHYEKFLMEAPTLESPRSMLR